MLCNIVQRASSAVLLLAFSTFPASAATFTVDTTVDAVDAVPGDHQCATAAGACSLRAAVMEANAIAGLDEVVLPAGIFTLTRTGSGEDAGATGDLDVTDDLTLTGAGEGGTVVDGGALDRVFDGHPPAIGLTLWLIGMTVRNGAITGQNHGGCFRNPENARLLFDRVTVTGCRSLSYGSGVFNGGYFEAIYSSFVANGNPEGSDGHGGAVANVGTDAKTYVLYSELLRNGAVGGGGLYTSADFVTPNTSEVRIEHSSLIGNVAQNGGAILNNSRTRVYLEDSTVSGNLAGSGGGLFNDGGGFFFVRNSTITRNHATNIGGGISEVHFDDDFIRLRNSILAGNTADFLGPDCNFRILSEGGTILGSDQDCDMTIDFGDQVGVDPRLGPLLRLGAHTWAHLPLPGSPAIDRGTAALCSPSDQREIVRPFDGDENGQATCDIGAIEIAGDLFASGFETGDFSEWTFAMQ